MNQAPYLGHFVHQVDGEGRIGLPAQWRGNVFTVRPVEIPAPHLTATPDAGGSKLDGAGRLSMPAELLRSAGIAQEVVLIGLLERFELGSPVEYCPTTGRSTDLQAQVAAK